MSYPPASRFDTGKCGVDRGARAGLRLCRSQLLSRRGCVDRLSDRLRYQAVHGDSHNESVAPRRSCRPTTIRSLHELQSLIAMTIPPSLARRAQRRASCQILPCPLLPARCGQTSPTWRPGMRRFPVGVFSRQPLSRSRRGRPLQLITCRGWLLACATLLTTLYEMRTL